MSKIANIPAEFILSGFTLIKEFESSRALGFYDFEHPLEPALDLTVRDRDDRVTVRLSGFLAHFHPRDGETAADYVGRVVRAIDAAREGGRLDPEFEGDRPSSVR
jgi:hypothetical protein